MKDKNTKQRKQMIEEMSKKKRDFISTLIEEAKVTIAERPKYKIKNGKVVELEGYDIYSNVPNNGLNFLQAFIILVITLVLFTVIFPLIQRAVDIQSLQTCEVYGDCAEVIKHINQ